MPNELDPRFLLSVLLRRFPVFLLTAVVIFSGFAAAAVLIPAAYTSSAKILVESQQIPTALVQSTVNSAATERLRVIQQRLMTRDNLLEIAAEFNVFRDRRDMSPTEIVEEMRKQSSFEADSLATRRRGDSGLALVFNVSFSSPNASVAARVAGEYVTRILEDNLKLRTARAADTYEFFEQETQRLGGELTAIEAEMVDFKRANRDTLPETLDFRTNQLQRVQQQLQLLDREVANLQERRKNLLEVVENPSALADQDRPLTESERIKQQLTRELELRSALLSDQHPEIRALRTRIAALDSAIEQERKDLETQLADHSSKLVETEMKRVRQQIEEIDTRLSQIADETTQLERQEASLQRSIGETPNTQMALAALQRNYGNLQQQYADARSKLAVSATGEQLELKQQAERFEVIEEAVVPERPDKPNRVMIIAMGVGAGGGGGLALIVLLEFLNKAIRRPSDIINALEMQPLAVIPYIYTDEELRRRARVKWSLTVLTVGGALTGLMLLHLYYLPLDLLVKKVMVATELDALLELVRSRLKF
ncbi:MAG: hypothetical protein VYD87_17000 [Pseudomonadota bacterium]|nr:hypothetical protein [Pseudomonadota bacterium]MEE3100078.1 hypothetical protein [Pseudomonadota bacterium]